MPPTTKPKKKSAAKKSTAKPKTTWNAAEKRLESEMTAEELNAELEGPGAPASTPDTVNVDAWGEPPERTEDPELERLTGLQESRFEPHRAAPERDLELERLQAAARGGLPETPVSPDANKRQTAMLAEEMRRNAWRQAIAEDEARRAKLGIDVERDGPRVPMRAGRQRFRSIDKSEPPKGALPEGRQGAWVCMEDSRGRPSMHLVREHQDWGYEYARNEKGEPVVGDYGVLMHADPKDVAARTNHYAPLGAMNYEDTLVGAKDAEREENRAAGRTVAHIRTTPEHRRERRVDD